MPPHKLHFHKVGSFPERRRIPLGLSPHEQRRYFHAGYIGRPSSYGAHRTRKVLWGIETSDLIPATGYRQRHQRHGKTGLLLRGQACNFLVAHSVALSVTVVRSVPDATPAPEGLRRALLTYAFARVTPIALDRTNMTND